MSRTKPEILKELTDNERLLRDRLLEYDELFDRYANHGDHNAKERAQQKVYPTLGQQKYVTLQGRPWKGKTAKQPNEKWINIYIQPQSMGDVSQDQLKALIGELKTLGYTPLLGIPGIGGPYGTGFGPLGDAIGSDTKVFYFSSQAERMANEVRTLTSRVLTLRVDDTPILVDTSKFDDSLKFVIDSSGIDVQLYILAQHS
jgi:hypothetical protein